MRCVKCGIEVEDGVQFCTACGAALSKKTTTMGRGMRVALWSAAGLAALLMMCFLFIGIGIATMPGHETAAGSQAPSAPAPATAQVVVIPPPQVEVPEPVGKYTGKSLAGVAELVHEAHAASLLVRVDGYRAYVNPWAWRYLNVDQKEGFAMICADFASLQHPEDHTVFIEIYDYQGGKRLAKLGALGFEVD